MAGEQQDVHVRVELGFAHALAERGAIHAGHVPVRQQDLVLPFENLRERFLAVLRRLDHVAGARELPLEHHALGRLVLDEQQAESGLRRSLMLPSPP